MRRIIFAVFLMCIYHLAAAQYNDLIVNSDGDSIACRILNVNDSVVIFNMKDANRTIQITQIRSEVKEIKYGVVQKGMYHYKRGTSHIIGNAYPISSETYTIENLQNSSTDELRHYYYKSDKLQKSGKTTNIVGFCAIGGAGIYRILGPQDLSTIAIAALLGATGIGVLSVGIPMNITGKKRVQRINSVRNTVNNDTRIKLQPFVQNNIGAQKYHPGVSLKISF